LVGFSFLADWLIDGRTQMTGPEYLLMLAIMVAVALLGFLAAVLLGMAAAVALFAVAYSRVDPVRHVSTGRERRSTMARSPSEHRVMHEQGGSIVIVELQGYLFFGTARSLLARAREIVDTTPGLSCLLIDLRRVQGTDSTAIASFVKLTRLANREELTLILSDLPVDLEAALTRAMGDLEDSAGIADDLDRAMEMAENHVLGEDRRGAGGTTLADIFGADLWAKIQPGLDRYDVETGGLLIDHGDASVGLFLVDYGRIVAEIPGGEGRWQRVVSCGPGTILGEMSVYLGSGRSARLRAEEPTCVFTLSPEAIVSLERSDPRAAAELHRRLATVMAERLAISNETVGALLR
jgi:SulP family sulfate permease